jgi:hypothetical protein
LDVIISVLVMSILSRVPHVKDWIGAKWLFESNF